MTRRERAIIKNILENIGKGTLATLSQEQATFKLSMVRAMLEDLAEADWKR